MKSKAKRDYEKRLLHSYLPELMNQEELYYVGFISSCDVSHIALSGIIYESEEKSRLFSICDRGKHHVLRHPLP